MSKSKLILLVDDDLDDRNFFMDAVEAIGGSHRCIISDDGEKALRLLTKPFALIPDYIFLDLNMPRMNRKQFLKKIKSIEILQSIPVIIYSTTRQPEDVEETQRLGAVYFLTKPQTFDEISEAVFFVLNEKWTELIDSEKHV